VVVLAATFTVLGVLPLVFLADLGFAVAFGVLLDTFIVRVVLVSALAYDIGPTIWWPPSKLAATGQQFPRTGRPPRTRPPADAMTATTPCITP
jgi:RND superfamily putative drug exporter